MSRTARTASYPAALVSSRRPARSPTAYTVRTAVRPRSSTCTPRSATTMPASSRPRPCVFGVRPAATRTPAAEMRTRSPSCPTIASNTAPPCGWCCTRRTSASVCTTTPSSASTSVRRATNDGSRCGSSVCDRCSKVTGTPRRCIAWAISAPIGPPPMMARLAGGASSRNRFSLVRHHSVLRPSIGGMCGRLPVHSSTNRVSSTTDCPSDRSTETSLAPTRRAWPKNRSTPISRYRCGLSSVPAMAACTARAATPQRGRCSVRRR